MRRKDREIRDIDEIVRILNEAQVCRLALFDGEYPYIIPMCFGFDLHGDKLELYFHCAAQGKKLDLIKENNRAAFEIDKLMGIVGGEIACGYTADYECITGVGTVDIINGIEKLTGLNTIVKKYAENISDKRFSEEMLNNVVVLKLTVNEFCCKAHKPQD